MIPMTIEEQDELARYKAVRQVLHDAEHAYAAAHWDLGAEAKHIEALIDLRMAHDPTLRNDTARKAQGVIERQADERLVAIEEELLGLEQEVRHAKAQYDAAHMTMRVILAQTVRDER